MLFRIITDRVEERLEGGSKASPLIAIDIVSTAGWEMVAMMKALRDKVSRKRYHRRWFERVNNEMVDTVLRVNNSIYLQNDDDRERKAEKES